jgi:hypothetical protein
MVERDLKAAMTSRDAVKLSVLRFLKSALKYYAIERKLQELSDFDTLQVIQKQIKQRRESIDQFVKASREELAAKERKELEILESYLPKQLSDTELEAQIGAYIQAENATSKKDFGRIMKLLNEKLAGQADAKRISEILGKKLA